LVEGDEPHCCAALPLDLVESFLQRFVAYPSEHALVAHVLWIAHCHMFERFDTTPRLAFMSAEKESGKSRALEVTALFVPEPVLSISASPAVIVRLISRGRCTILYDEIDGVFGNAKVQEANTDLRSILNGGYRRGAKVYRCNTSGKKVEVEELDAFAPVAVAGLRNLPDTLASRSIFVHMRRRAADEEVEPFRHAHAAQQAKPIMEALTEWCAERDAGPVDVDLPHGIVDRAADCWEPLLVAADEAGSDWPTRARAAAVYLTKNATDESMTIGVELLAHIKEAFGAEHHLATTTLIEHLVNRDESPWKDIRGKPLDGLGLARRLKPYRVKSKPVRLGQRVAKGYSAEDFADAWKRYLEPASAPPPPAGYTGYKIDNQNKNVTPVTPVTPTWGQGRALGHPSHCRQRPLRRLQRPLPQTATRRMSHACSSRSQPLRYRLLASRPCRGRDLIFSSLQVGPRPTRNG
jgi:hypothetical protein